MILTQYYQVFLSSPNLQASERVTRRDLTPYMAEGLTFMDEDGKIKELTFELTEGYMWLDIIVAGMNIEMRGGDLNRAEFLFTGFVKRIEPDFGDDGDVKVKVIAASNESKHLSTNLKNLIYPSKNHPATWARREVLASEIILRLAEEAGYKRGNVQIRKDVTYTMKTPVAQSNKSDWVFMNMLADKIECVMWTEVIDGDEYINLVDEEMQVNTVAGVTFFYASRQIKDGTLNYLTSPNALQMDSVRITQDTTDGKKGQITTQINPKTGQAQVVTEQRNSKGEWQKWELDEAKLEKLDATERQSLIDLFMSGQLAWEDGSNGVVGVQRFFKLAVTEQSSREPVSSVERTDVTASGTDGLGTGTVSTTANKKYATKVDEAKLKNLSPEERSQVMGRIARNEMTETDKQFYQVEEIKQPDKKNTAEGATTPPAKNQKAQQAQPKRKRDAGFKIEVTCSGDLRVKTRKSYILEGLSKYSGKYYLYRRYFTFGSGGFKMNLIFTK